MGSAVADSAVMRFGGRGACRRLHSCWSFAVGPLCASLWEFGERPSQSRSLYFVLTSGKSGGGPPITTLVCASAGGSS